MGIFLACLSVNFIANDKPLLVKYQDNYYFPVLKSYPETTFGGVFETETEYKDPVVQDLINQNGYMIMPIIQFADQTPSFDRVEAFPHRPTLKIGLAQTTMGEMYWLGCCMACGFRYCLGWL